MSELIPFPEISLMAANIFQQYQTCRNQARNPDNIDLQMRIKWRLGDAVISPESLANSILPLYEIFEDKRALLGAAYQYVERLTQNRSWTDDEKFYFAGYMGSRPADNYNHFIREGHVRVYPRKCETDEIPTVQRGEEYEFLNSRLPNAPFLSNFSPIEIMSLMGDGLWNRGEDQYPQTKRRTLSQSIQKVINIRKHASILDVGCGDNYFLHQMKQRFGSKIKTMGVKPDNTHISDRPVDEEYCGYAELLPIDWSESTDIAVCNTALTYFWYPEKAVSEIVRVLRPGGEAHIEIYKDYSAGHDEFDIVKGILGISKVDYERETAQNFRYFQSRRSFQELIDKIAYAQNTKLSVYFGNGYHVYKK